LPSGEDFGAEGGNRDDGDDDDEAEHEGVLDDLPTTIVTEERLKELYDSSAHSRPFTSPRERPLAEISPNVHADDDGPRARMGGACVRAAHERP